MSKNLNCFKIYCISTNTSILKGAYQRIVIGANMYKLNSDGSSLGITYSDALVSRLN